jgi:hypothetical protein
VPISPRRVLVFRASHALKDQINSGLSQPVTRATASAASGVRSVTAKAAPG